MSALTIRATGLSKLYRLGKPERYKSLRESLSRAAVAPFRRIFDRSFGSREKEPFWALKDVSFEVNHGEVLGIIGRNGAGKSTLLKILSRITRATEGRALIHGRVRSLLEVGTGFHPELTGRENIFLNGAILGMRKAEIASKFDEIVAFAEVDQFLDTPVKHFSSGMYVRLAFAIAAHLEPEILIVDEVLAVGDVAFQRKCLGKMNEVRRQGRTVLFVSHNMAAIENFCSRGLVLHQGKLVFDGGLKDAVHYYLNTGAIMGTANGHVFDLCEAPSRRSNIGKLLKRVELHTDGNLPILEEVRIGSRVKISVHFDLPKPVNNFDVALGFDDLKGQRIFTAHSRFEPNRPAGQWSGPQVFVCDIPSFTLMPGTYTMRLWLDINGAEADLINWAAHINVVECDYYGTGKAPWNGLVVLKHNWYSETTLVREPTHVDSRAE
jgi:lipopolysaccharide transport system ATP-binding protein